MHVETGALTPPRRVLPLGVRAAAAWMLFAALGQLCFLAHWPLYVGDRVVGDWGTLAVAVFRLGVYAALGLGLLQGDRTAWAATVLELGRSFALFLIPVWGADRQLLGALFPGSWAQGALSGCVPLLILANGALAAGWSPGSRMDLFAAIAVRVAAGLCAFSALGLRRRFAPFGLSEAESGPALWRAGLPVVAAISAVELAALWLGR
jgi:hypothetical protein